MAIDLERGIAAATTTERRFPQTGERLGKPVVYTWLLAGSLFLGSPATAQPLTAIADSGRAETHPAFKLTHYIVPAVLMTGGLLTQGTISQRVRDRVIDQYPNFTTHADDVGQFAPTVAVLGLGAAGVKGRHAFGDQIALTVLSHGLAQTVTQVLKRTVAYPRPDGVGNDAFPSGHTTFAFTGAALLAHEYGGQSAWYTVGGYTVATGVGALRVLKNRHWLADVLFGAGVGIGATEAVYQAYPWLKHLVVRRKNVALVPFYNGTSGGAYFLAVF